MIFFFPWDVQRILNILEEKNLSHFIKESKAQEVFFVCSKHLLDSNEKVCKQSIVVRVYLNGMVHSHSNIFFTKI